MEPATIEQTTTVAEGGTAITIGQLSEVRGDIQVGQISNFRVVAESHFYELNVERLEAERAIDPPKAEELARLLQESRLLILAGELEDKTECARDVAARLLRRLEAQGRKPVLRERCRGKEPQRIETAFLEDKTAILLLTEISQSLIAGYGPASLRRLLAERDGYAIVTTDCTREQWEIHDGSAEAPLWQDLTFERYYGLERLAGHLEQSLLGTGFEIPAELLSDEPDGEWRVGGVPLRAAAAKLKTPGRIRSFVRALTEGTAPPTPEGVAAKLAELAGDSAAVRQWYLQFDDRDQLLVLGMVLLDGLPDDLLFAGLEILVETTWRQTDPNFRQFDYRDLSRFAAYFKLTPSDGGFVRIETGSRQRRTDILLVAWSHQRRRLLAALPALVEMIRVSAGEPAGREGGRDSVSPARLAAERALSRSQSGSMQLHQALVESLSLIGLLSLEVVEPYLLDLAAGTSESVQLLVAQALAAWREAGREEEFFALLQRWWKEACEVGRPGSEIARARHLSTDPWAAVRAAIALTVSYAAQYDRENRLAPQLVDLLAVLVDDPHPRVRSAVWRHTVPRAVAWHLRQLVPLLRQRVLVTQEFVQAVARGAAEACEMRPDECLPILANWWEEARADAQRGTRRLPARREILLATVAETFGCVRSSPEGEPLPAALIVANLRAILDEERHRFVRWHALLAVATQTQDDPEAVAQLLPALLRRLQIEDRAQVMELAVRVYLHQRQELAGGDRKLEIDGRSYAVWSAGQRPLTAIEATLYTWLADPARPVAQQVAVTAFSAFAATALDQEEGRLLGGSGEKGAAAKDQAHSPEFEPEVHPLGAMGHLALALATSRRKELRPVLHPVMAEVVAVLRQRLLRLADWRKQVARLRKSAKAGGPAIEAEREARANLQRIEGAAPVAAILKRWEDQEEGAAREIASHLRRAVKLYRLRWAVVAGLGLFLTGALWLLLLANLWLRGPIERWTESRLPSPTVPLDLYAPLPPGERAGRPERWPWLLLAQPLPDEANRAWLKRERFRLAPYFPLPAGPPPRPQEERPLWLGEEKARWDDSRESAQLWVRPRPYTLDPFAAPLPPGCGRAAEELRARREETALETEPTVKDIAWTWRKRIYLTRGLPTGPRALPRSTRRAAPSAASSTSTSPRSSQDPSSALGGARPSGFGERSGYGSIPGWR